MQNARAADGSTQPLLVTEKWEVDVVQWECGPAASPYPPSSPHPSGSVNGAGPSMAADATDFEFSQAGTNTRYPFPVWTPFRSLSWEPTERKARLTNDSAEFFVPPAHVDRAPYVWNQGPLGTSAGLVDEGRCPAHIRRGGSARDDSRNSVSAKAVARMEAVASSETSRRARDHAKKGFKGRRSIQFNLPDLLEVERYCFSTPHELKLTDNAQEWSDARRVEPIAWRFCFFGPVGVILKLRGKLCVYLVLPSAREADLVQNFFRDALQRVQEVDRQSPLSRKRVSFQLSSTKQVTGNQPRKSDWSGPQGRSSPGLARSDPRTGPAGERGARTAAEAAGGDTSRAAQQSRREGSSIFDQSSHLSASDGRVGALTMPDSDGFYVCPAELEKDGDVSAEGRQTSGTSASVDGGQHEEDNFTFSGSKLHHVYLRPSRKTRAYMKGVNPYILGGPQAPPLPPGGASGGAGQTAGTRRTGGDAQSPSCFVAEQGPLNIHLVRSRYMWWQRFKNVLSGDSPHLTVDLRTCSVTNLSPHGSALLWQYELPSPANVPLHKHLLRIYGRMTQGPSCVDSRDTRWHGRTIISFANPTKKEAWLRWFELMGARAQWSCDAPSSPADAPDGARGTLQRPRSPEHAVPPALTVSVPSSVNDGVEFSPSEGLSEPATVKLDPSQMSRERLVFQSGHNDPPPPARDVYLHDTSSSSSRSGTGDRKDADPSAAVGLRKGLDMHSASGSTGQLAGPALPLHEKGGEDRGAGEGKSTESRRKVEDSVARSSLPLPSSTWLSEDVPIDASTPERSLWSSSIKNDGEKRKTPNDSWLKNTPVRVAASTLSSSTPNASPPTLSKLPPPDSRALTVDALAASTRAAGHRPPPLFPTPTKAQRQTDDVYGTSVQPSRECSEDSSIYCSPDIIDPVGTDGRPAKQPVAEGMKRYTPAAGRGASALAPSPSPLRAGPQYRSTTRTPSRLAGEEMSAAGGPEGSIHSVSTLSDNAWQKTPVRGGDVELDDSPAARPPSAVSPPEALRPFFDAPTPQRAAETVTTHHTPPNKAIADMMGQGSSTSALEQDQPAFRRREAGTRLQEELAADDFPADDDLLLPPPTSGLAS